MKRHQLMTAAVLAMCGTTSAFAAGPLVLWGNASLSDLQLSVSDFRLNDGIAANATLTHTGSGWVGTSCCDFPSSLSPEGHQNTYVTGDNLTQGQAARVELPGGNNAAERTVDGARVQFGIDKTQFEAVNIYRDKWDYNDVGAGSSVSLEFYQLELTPGAEITLSGRTTADIWADLSQQHRHGSGLVANTTAQTSLQVFPLSMSGLEFVVRPDADKDFAGGQVTQYISYGEVISDGPSELHESSSFRYVIRNVSAENLSVALNWRVSVGGSAYYSGVPVVPEPSTWLLGAFGLLACVGLGRRERPQARWRRRATKHAASPATISA